MNVIETRKALAQALTAHDPSAVKSFLDPSFVVRGADDVVTMKYEQLVTELPEFFKLHPEYQQTVEIERSKIDGNVATLLTRRSEVLRVLWWSHAVSSRWNETWKNTDGRWMLLDEKPSSG